MKLSAFSRSLVVAITWLAVGLTAARAQTALPSAQVGVAYSYTVTTNPVAAAGTSYSATGLPTGLAIGQAPAPSTSGVISGTPTTAGTYTGAVSLTSNGVTNSFNYTLTVSGAAGTPAISSATTISATAGTAISAYTVTASNSPTSFNVGSLPAGLTLGGTTTVPTISGTPTTAGTYTASLSANNGSGTGSVTTLTINVAASAAAPVISSSLTFAASALNSPLTTSPNPGNYTITASNSPASFSATGLPVGLSLNTTTGVISGTPTVGGIYSVTLRATNNSGTGPAATLVMTLGSLPVINSAATASGNVGSAFSYTVSATNTPGGFTISGLPPGLSADTTSGAITGSPTSVGSFTLTATATNVVGTGPSSTITINIASAIIGGGGGGGGVIATAPIITSSPAAVSVNAGDTAIFQVFAAGTGTLTYQWRKNGSAIAGATGATYSINVVTGSDDATYDVVVSNSVGSTTSASAKLTVTGLLTPPVITAQPTNQTAALGGTATFTVSVTGNPAPTYQWRKDAVAISGATLASLTLTNISAASVGAYSVVVSNSQGVATSSAATFTISTIPLPALTTQPIAQTSLVGGTVTFSASATGTGLSYQWSKNGVAIAGATSATLSLTNVQGSDSGVYSVTVTNASGSVTSTAATLSVPAARLANVSVRSAAGTGDQTLIVGLSVGGSGSKNVLVRAIGPGLTQFGLAGVLADPQLRLFNAAGVQTNLNDDWGGGATLSNAFTAVGAFSLPATSKDAALLVPVAAGAYTAQITATSGTGIALLEAYDSDATPATARLVNISARTQVGIGDNVLVIGFVVTGSGSKNILLRGVGPGLTQFGVGGVLADPQLGLYNSSGVAINTNDNWGGASALTTAFTQTGAFSLPSASRDAALVVSLPPGAYTAQVSGVGATTGVALIEVYELP